MQQKKYSDQHRKERKLSIGQTVWARNFREVPCWVRAAMSHRSGPVSFIVILEDRNLWRRHIDHLQLGVSATLEYPQSRGRTFFLFPTRRTGPGAPTDGESPTVSQHDSTEFRRGSSASTASSTTLAANSTATRTVVWDTEGWRVWTVKL